MREVETILEFDKVKEHWKELALTDQAKAWIHEAAPILEEGRVRTKLKETAEARLLIEKNGNPPLVSLNGFREWLEVARMGGCLMPDQLEGIELALVAADRLKRYLNQGKSYDISLAYYEENLDASEEIRNAIRDRIRSGRVDDSASKTLKSCRMEMEREERAMREKAEAVMRANKACMADSFSTMRDGRMCIPVKKEFKNRIGGTVIGQSATGSTVFLEPASVAKHHENLAVLEIQEENEVRRILYELTELVYQHLETLEENIRMMERLDFIFSKGKLSLALGGSEPCINTERRIRLKDARHPLMDPSVCVPLQFSIGEGVQGIVITGPNTGGKTVGIKTVALNCMMAQCGLHPACSEADICLNSNFLCDIGDGQNLSENLSTFSAHIANVLDILSQVNRESLVIMDELGSGTDPAEGMGIAVAVLEELKKSGALFLVTTHYPEVKQYAERTEGIVNARMTFDKESLRPLYQLVIGEAGESCAFYIAGKMGMPRKMLETAAQAAYGNQQFPDELNILADQGILKQEIKKASSRMIRKQNTSLRQLKNQEFHRGDSVMVFPDRKIGIVCQPENEKGVLQVQLPGRKIWINRKRVKLHVAAEKLYPEDYDFSIIFDTVENRKLRHQVERGKMLEGKEIRISEGR